MSTPLTTRLDAANLLLYFSRVSDWDLLSRAIENNDENFVQSLNDDFFKKSPLDENEIVQKVLSLIQQLLTSSLLSEATYKVVSLLRKITYDILVKTPKLVSGISEEALATALKTFDKQNPIYFELLIIQSILKEGAESRPDVCRFYGSICEKVTQVALLDNETLPVLAAKVRDACEKFFTCRESLYQTKNETLQQVVSDRITVLERGKMDLTTTLPHDLSKASSTVELHIQERIQAVLIEVGE